MCLMDFITFLGCGHTEYVFPETGYCDFGFDTKKQSCSKGANELRCVKIEKSVTSNCSPCYEEELTKIRAEHMEQYCKFVQKAAERGLSTDEVKEGWDKIMKNVMKATMEWKMTSELEGTTLSPLSSSSYPLQR